MTKRNTLYTLLGLIALVWLGSWCYNRAVEHKRDQTIHSVTEKAAKPFIKCDQQYPEKRIECLKEKIDQVSNKEFVSKFNLITEKGQIELVTEDMGSWVKITRPSKVKLYAGSCIVSFFFFDLDESYIYLSKDNASGLVVCGDNSNWAIIAPSNFSPERAKKEAAFLKNLKFN